MSGRIDQDLQDWRMGQENGGMILSERVKPKRETLFGIDESRNTETGNCIWRQAGSLTTKYSLLNTKRKSQINLALCIIIN